MGHGHHGYVARRVVIASMIITPAECPCSHQHHHQPRRGFPDDEEYETRECEGEVVGVQDGTGPDRAVECGAENADDGGVGAAHGGLSHGAFAKAVPEWQGADQQKRIPAGRWRQDR